MKAFRSLYVLAMALPLCAAGICGNPTAPATAENPFAGLRVFAESKILALGESATFHCLAYNAKGGESTGNMTYGLQGSALVQGSAPNQESAMDVKAVAIGKSTLTCTFKAVTGETMTASGVYEVKDLVIQIDPAEQTALKGSTKSLVATVRHPGTGEAIPLAEGAITWKSSATQFVTVPGNAATLNINASAINGPGTSTITATFLRHAAFGHTMDQNGSGTAIVNVALDPNASALTVVVGTTAFVVTSGSSVFVPYTVQNASGAAVTDHTVTTSTTGPCTVLSSTQSSVLVRGTAAGSCGLTITAAKDGATGSKTVPITVNPAPATTAQLVGAGSGTPVGGTRQLLGVMPTGDIFTFAALAGAIASATTPPWAYQLATGFTSSNTAVATVSATGVITGVSAGTTTITGQWSSGGVDYQASITETVGTLDATTPQSISMSTLSGLSNTVRVGKVTAYRCSGTNASGGAVVANPVWTTSNAAAATVNSAGIVTGVAAGTATITCNINSRTTTMPTTVTP